MQRIVHATALAVALAAPVAARALPVGDLRWLVEAPGEQTKPSIDGPYVVYADHSGADWDVRMYDLSTGTTVDVAVGPGDQQSPDVSRSVVAYRAPSGIEVYSIPLRALLRSGAEQDVAGAPATSEAVVAWERDAADGSGRDVVWSRLLQPKVNGVLGGPGDQHAPAAFGDWVGLVDDADGGAVRMLDTTTGEVREVCPGRATGLAMDGAPDAPRVVVARDAGGGDTDVEVYDTPGVLGAALRVPGTQRNPHVSGDWVAFEDLSTGHSQVVLWNLATGTAFVPHPSASDQILNDVSAVPGQSVRVVFADDAHGDLDIAMYTLPLPLADDGAPANWPPAPPPARCDDPAAIVLADLTLARETGKPFVAQAPLAGAVTEGRVLVCLDAMGVSSAGVVLGDRPVIAATPADFAIPVHHLERVVTIEPGDGRVAAAAAGVPGATLRVRVLGGAVPPLACEGPGCGGHLDGGPGTHGAPRGQGCGSAGAGLAPLGLAAALLRRRRRA
ncbi:hypothetical protein [Anaeromyxobacter oryzae]|uniref:Uncharacterized protein n=1 Tax=Anaeromyxobacter oryzae TaxID=2918170 RepID=A0ABM7X4T3_9BACT|nr:hypothetical protein [Anaeromyxobacter oryzae]BDG06827.1 hypothetical protein AMOR_58230 [Anaeromyxobacter oryzae]